MMLAAAVMVVGSILKGVGEMQANKQNALNAKAEGESAMKSAEAEQSRQHTINQAKLGEMRADAGAQGSTFEGSPMLAYLDSVKNAALGEQDILYRGQVAKFGKKMEAGMYSRQASSALFSGIMGGASSAASAYAGGAFGGGAGAAGGSSLGSSLLTSK